MPTTSRADNDFGHFHHTAAIDESLPNGSAQDWVSRIVASSDRPADLDPNASFGQQLSELLAGHRTTRLVLGRSRKECIVVELFGNELARIRLEGGRFVIELNELVDVERQDVAA